MSPYEKAKEIYWQEPCANTFRVDLEFHFRHGYVISTPRIFMMFRQVERWSDPELIVNPEAEFVGGDCWHVHVAAGDMTEMLEHFPFPKPWISFERKNDLRFHHYQKITERVANLSHGASRRTTF